MPEDTQPIKRVPARSRKPAAVEHAPKHAAPDSSPADPRIGEAVDPAALSISFPDGTEYRCENGTIVERVR